MGDYDHLPDNLVDLIREHRKLYLTDPEQAHMWDARPVGLPGDVPTLLLTVTGRRSGKVRHCPVLYTPGPGVFYIVGSRGGSPGHPSWYLNLREMDDCEIRVGARRTRAVWRELQGDERTRVWAQVAAAIPVYDAYQARTDRQIPLIELTPQDAPAAG